MLSPEVISDDQLKLLLADPGIKQEQDKVRAIRHESHKQWHEWLNPDSIASMSDVELKDKFLKYYETGAERHTFIQINRDRIIRNPDKLKKLLCYLFDERVDIKKRLENILNKKGEYYLEGVGKGLATSFLLDFDPQKYCVWNNKVTDGLRALGLFPPSARGEKLSERYLKILEISKKIKELSPEPNNNFIDVDHFYHIVAVEPVGRAALNGMLGLKVEEVQEAADLGASVQFSMEKGLEEFIAENFSNVFHDLELYKDELYQDEESLGRQFRTDVGPVDFLARDKKNGDLVVIELKLGRPSDAVVGQILRYMQWVEENLLDTDKGKVKGIVIAKEQDEKLRYALKRVPDVEFYSYKVEFEVKKQAK